MGWMVGWVGGGVEGEGLEGEELKGGIKVEELKRVIYLGLFAA